MGTTREVEESFVRDLRLLFEASPDVLLVLLPDAPRFTMVAATNARLAATHTTREDTIGRGLFEVFPDNPDDPSATGTSNLRASLNRALETRAPDTMAVQRYDIRGPDGAFHAKYWSPKNIPVLDASGRVLYILHRVEDVTELVQATELGEELRGKAHAMEREILKRSHELSVANEKLRGANTRLGELDVAKTAFFSNVSHEFRTPLTLMLGPIEDALASPERTLGGEALERTQRNALRLMRLVNSLLDFSKIEAGRIQAASEATDLCALVTFLASAFRSAIERAGLELHVECEPLPEPVFVDHDLFEKIVLNLLSNALKFTFEGRITVAVKWCGTHTELSVSDTGTGIPEHELPHMFERFHRVAGARSRTHEGSGIGLALVHELVRLHGGTIRVTSTVGVGTTFTLSIPRGSAHLPPERIMTSGEASRSSRLAPHFVRESLRWAEDSKTAGLPPPSASNGEGARILVVDDNADLRAYITGILSAQYTVETANDGLAALEAARRRRPTLILSDVMMPKLDGFGLLRELRADQSLRELPVILLSARAGEEATIEGLEGGADDYLVKPFAARELLARVRTHVELARQRAAVAFARDLAEAANQELEAFSYTVAHDLRAPLRSIDGFTEALIEEHAQQLDDEGRQYLSFVRQSSQRMTQLIDDLLALAKVTRSELRDEEVDLSQLARAAITGLQRSQPDRRVEITIQDGVMSRGDARLLSVVFENLLGNSWKFTQKREGARISFTSELRDGQPVYVVRDNGAGFDAAFVNKLFGVFQRLHSTAEFEGTGIGLATVRRVVNRHHGRVWAEGAVERGASFFFTLNERGHLE